MSDEQKIEVCPLCGSTADIICPFGTVLRFRLECGDEECLLAGPIRRTKAEAIRAWNQMALAFEIARAVALQHAAESAAWDDENTTQQQHDKCLMVEQDANNALPALLGGWRQTRG